MILPVAIPADDDEAFGRELVVRQPAEEIVAFISESTWVDVVVPLRATAGSHHGCRGEKDLEGGVALQQGSLEPIPLFLPPDRLPGTVGKIVGAAVVTSLHDPDLEVPVHSPRGVGHRIGCSWIDDRILFPEHPDPQFVGRSGAGTGVLRVEVLLGVGSDPVLGIDAGRIDRIGVVEPVVVIVFQPVGGHSGEQIQEPLLRVLLLVLHPQLVLGLRPSSHLVGASGAVVVDVVSQTHEEIGLQGQNGSQRRIAQRLVRSAVGRLGAPPGVVEFAVVHAGGEGEAVGDLPGFPAQSGESRRRRFLEP